MESIVKKPTRMPEKKVRYGARRWLAAGYEGRASLDILLFYLSTRNSEPPQMKVMRDPHVDNTRVHSHNLLKAKKKYPAG